MSGQFSTRTYVPFRVHVSERLLVISFLVSKSRNGIHSFLNTYVDCLGPLVIYQVLFQKFYKSTSIKDLFYLKVTHIYSRNENTN